MQMLWGYLQLVSSCSLSFFFLFNQTKAKQVRARVFYFTVPQEFHNNQISRKRHEGSEKDVQQRSVCLVQLIDPDHCISPRGWDVRDLEPLLTALSPLLLLFPCSSILLSRSAEGSLLAPCNFCIVKYSKNTTKPMLIWGQRQLQA